MPEHAAAKNRDDRVERYVAEHATSIPGGLEPVPYLSKAAN
jgi:hypothetical protein